MANDTRLNIVVDNAKAIPAIEETGKAVEELRERSRGATKGTKKDWGGIADLFSSVLPRGLSRTLRSFKSTTRQVSRLSRTFKVLKGAIVSTGIGVLIIALGEVIANWDKITEAIGLSNKEAEKTRERYQGLAKDIRDLESDIVPYLETLLRVNASEEERVYAAETLNKQLGNVIDSEATLIEQREQALALLKAQERLMVKKNLADAYQLRIEESREALEIEQAKRIRDFDEIARLRKQIRLDTEELYFASQDVITAETEINNLLTKASELRDERLDAERKAAAATAKRKALEESNAKFLLQLEKDLNEQIFLAGIEDEQKRAETELAMRTVEMEEKARLAGASAEQLKLIEEGFLLDLAELRERYKDDEPDPQDIIDDQEALREQLRRVDLQENEKDVQQAQDLFDERMELAHGDRELEKQAEELFESEIDAIQVFYRDKKAADDKAAKEQEIADAQEITDAKIQGFTKVANASRNLFGVLEGMAEENSKQQRALAITDILLAQAVSVANAIKTATKSSKDPFTLVASIVTTVDSVMRAFVGVNKILDQADAPSVGVGGLGASTRPTVPLIPLGRLGSPDTNNQAYVVQSQLEGQNLNAEQIKQQTIL